MIWEKVELDPSDVKDLARQYDIDLIRSSILLRRNLTDPDSVSFVMEDDLHFLHNPFLFQAMDQAVGRINRALEQGEKILVYGDKDVDGISSTVLMVQDLQAQGGRVDWLLPSGEDNYGLSLDLIEKLAGQDLSLLITVDCGISNGEEIALAASHGIDCIVLDHHNPPDSLPPAVAVIDPKTEGCRYPFRDLAAASVVAKLIWALHFSRNEIYGRDIWLLHIAPVNEAISVEAVCLRNLVEEERLFESLVPGLISVDKTRLFPRLAGKEVFVYQKEEIEKNLKLLGLTDGDMRLVDLGPDLAENFAGLAGKSLLKIVSISRLARYKKKLLSETDMLVHLYRSLVLRKNPELEAVQMKSMDLAALGTIADLMPLVNENKIIVRKGLEVINRMERPGLRELIVRQNLYGGRIGSKDIAWQISPVLNSAGRMGEPEKAARIFFSENSSDIEELIDYVLSLNKKRKNLGDTIWKHCFVQAGQSLGKAGNKFVIIYDKIIPRGITGIIASRLVSSFKVPALAISVGESKIVGSLRSPYPIGGFLGLFSDLLLSYGGHDQAAGFSLSPEFFPEFETRFFLNAKDHQPPDAKKEKLLIDAEVPPGYLNPDLIKVVEFFEPYGEGFPPLVFLTRGAVIDNLEIIGRREAVHLRLLLRIDKYRWPAVFWNAANRAGKDFDLKDTVDVVYRLGRNYFRNTETLQLTVLDIEKQ